MNLEAVKQSWENSEFWNLTTRDYFDARVNETPELKELRDFVEQNIFGFGERSFYWMWKLIVDEMPKEFTFLEIGVFRGQTTTLIQILAKLAGKKVKVYGVSPLDNTDGHWESDYKKDILDISKKFKVKAPYIFVGLSTNPELIKEVSEQTYDLVYIDGGHTYDVIKSDLENYPKLATKYLVIDDCCNDLKMPFGFFQGIEAVTKAVGEWKDERFEFMFNVIHNKVWRVK